MKLIFAVLDVSLTMGLTRCYKTEGFLHFYIHPLHYLLPPVKVSNSQIFYGHISSPTSTKQKFPLWTRVRPIQHIKEV